MQGERPCPDHPITIAPAGERVVVKLDGTVLADSRDALILKEASLNPVYYIPRADVAMSELSPSDTSTHCPYRGDASYCSARSGAAKDVAWSYEDPFDHMLIIRDTSRFTRTASMPSKQCPAIECWIIEPANQPDSVVVPMTTVRPNLTHQCRRYRVRAD